MPTALPPWTRPIPTDDPTVIKLEARNCGNCQHYTPEPIRPRFRCTSGGVTHGLAPFWAWFCADHRPKDDGRG